MGSFVAERVAGDPLFPGPVILTFAPDSSCPELFWAGRPAAGLLRQPWKGCQAGGGQRDQAEGTSFSVQLIGFVGKPFT